MNKRFVDIGMAWVLPKNTAKPVEFVKENWIPFITHI